MTDAEFIAHFSQLTPIQRDVFLAKLPELYPGGVKEAAKAADRVWASMAQPEEEAQVINPFHKGAMRASEIPLGVQPPSLWFGMYRSSVTFFVGETGAGKSSLLYNVAVHAARHEPLLGIPFGGSKPINVLYIDPENAGNWAEGLGGNCSTKLDRIGAGRPSNLVFHDGDGVNLSNPDTCDWLERWIKEEGFEMVIIDPIANLFRTKEENGNSEAADQFTRMKTMSRATGACIIAVHHTGKGTLNDYGRGASARLASADVGMMFRFKGEEDEVDDTFTGETRPRTDICRLQVTKNRLEGRGSVYMQMAGDDKFNRATFEDWRDNKGGEGRQNKADGAEQHIMSLLRDGDAHQTKEILDEVTAHGIGKFSAQKALLSLVHSERVKEERIGARQLVYRLANGNAPTEKQTANGTRAQEAVDSFFGDNGAENAEPPVMERMRF